MKSCIRLYGDRRNQNGVTASSPTMSNKTFQYSREKFANSFIGSNQIFRERQYWKVLIDLRNMHVDITVLKTLWTRRHHVQLAIATHSLINQEPPRNKHQYAFKLRAHSVETLADIFCKIWDFRDVMWSYRVICTLNGFGAKFYLLFQGWTLLLSFGKLRWKLWLSAYQYL